MEDFKTTPGIRFAGFTDAWEQRKFNLVFDPIPNNTLSRVNLNNTDGKIKNVHYGDILIKYGAVTDCRNSEIPFITGAEVSEYREQLLRDGDVLIADAAEDETVGKATEITGVSDISVVSGLHTIACRPKVKMQPCYLGYYLNSPLYHRQLLPLMQGIKVLSISRSNLAKTIVFSPISEQEQSQIGKLFADFDRLIALHQREYDKTVNIKKAMLEKMFPKNGADKPEIRFAGFTDAWEQRKLGELMEVSSASRVHKNEWMESGVPFFRSSDVVSIFKGTDNEKAFISYSLFDELSKKAGKVQKGDVLVTGGGSIGIPYLVRNNRPLYFKDADLIWLKNSRTIQGNFLYTFFTTPIFRNYVRSISHTGTIAHYTIEQVKGTSILLPKVDEQKEVGAFFANLDRLLALHQRELEKLQNMKKALLEKMFV